MSKLRQDLCNQNWIPFPPCCKRFLSGCLGVIQTILLLVLAPIARRQNCLVQIESSRRRQKFNSKHFREKKIAEKKREKWRFQMLVSSISFLSQTPPPPKVFYVGYFFGGDKSCHCLEKGRFCENAKISVEYAPHGLTTNTWTSAIIYTYDRDGSDRHVKASQSYNNGGPAMSLSVVFTIYPFQAPKK